MLAGGSFPLVISYVLLVATRMPAAPFLGRSKAVTLPVAWERLGGEAPSLRLDLVVLPLCRGDFGRVKEGETRRSRISVGLSLAGWNLPLVLVLPAFRCMQGPCPIERPPLPGERFGGDSRRWLVLGGNPESGGKELLFMTRSDSISGGAGCF